MKIFVTSFDIFEKKNHKKKNHKKKVSCKKCGWHWPFHLGGVYPYLCHNCDHDNTPDSDGDFDGDTGGGDGGGGI